ncbi:zinc carboxypeptidase-like [Arctopsyche grandis]|uniref:zinc carboxypeptidase-like n=1 Tax=Arctopsyche grandis TaxID=121162 RepID=UPI00406D764C
MKELIVLLVFCVLVTTEVQKYDGFKVYRLSLNTTEQLDFLHTLRDSMEGLDFWTGLSILSRPVDIMVDPKYEAEFLKTVKDQGIITEVFIENVQMLIDKEKVTSNSRSGMSWNSYHSLEDIYSWLDELAKTNPSITLINVGSTYEGRQIKGVKVSFNPGKRSVFIEGGIHAREWITPATVTYLINELLTSKDKSFRSIADGFDWYLFPVTNPDGYAFTHNSSRLWRKTRTPYSNCFGADPNRNWNAHWGVAGTSDKPCSEVYGGPAGFSELETSSLSKFISTVGPSLDAYLAFHSYGQMLLMPYGHTSQHLDNYDEVLRIGKAAINGLAKRYNTKYIVGNIAEIIYKASGSSMDWVKMTYKTPIAFTYELRDRGSSGFVLPANQIIPNCLEVVDSIVAMFQEGEKLAYFTLS